MFHGPSGVQSGSTEINPTDGSYTIELPTGERKVTVVAAAKAAATRGPGAAKEKSNAPPKGAELPADVRAKFERKDTGAKYVTLPEQYGDPAKSGLTVTIKGGSTTFDIPIP